MTWDLDMDISREMHGKSAPQGWPTGKAFIPKNLQLCIIDWAHSSQASGHPGITGTLAKIMSKYWWPKMATSVKTVVQLCSVCATTKASRQLPAGKLMPFPTPDRPWFHLAVDSIMDLPVSQGYMAIMVVVDRFSKEYRLIPFYSLSSALQVVESLFHHVFCCYGIPEEILSDHGPKFISQVWRVIFRHLGVTVSLTSGCHPQTNGQAEHSVQELGRLLQAYCSSQ